mmetsp:Transcript_61421/g.179529  ORF Transcript_61421/g.179529 Transcript_61421/m.179529 type:complete len:291 (+) Transcript_61421:613-1485(+)
MLFHSAHHHLLVRAELRAQAREELPPAPHGREHDLAVAPERGGDVGQHRRVEPHRVQHKVPVRLQRGRCKLESLLLLPDGGEHQLPVRLELLRHVVEHHAVVPHPVQPEGLLGRPAHERELHTADSAFGGLVRRRALLALLVRGGALRGRAFPSLTVVVDEGAETLAVVHQHRDSVNQPLLARGHVHGRLQCLLHVPQGPEPVRHDRVLLARDGAHAHLHDRLVLPALRRQGVRAEELVVPPEAMEVCSFRPPHAQRPLRHPHRGNGPLPPLPDPVRPHASSPPLAAAAH